MTCFAGDVDLGKASDEAILGPTIALQQVRRVAFGALAVPVLGGLGPVQDVAGVDALSRVEVEPPLAAVLARAGVPGDGQGLEAAARQIELGRAAYGQLFKLVESSKRNHAMEMTVNEFA